jgi:hypothetical protein
MPRGYPVGSQTDHDVIHGNLRRAFTHGSLAACDHNFAPEWWEDSLGIERVSWLGWPKDAALIEPTQCMLLGPEWWVNYPPQS